MVKQKNLGVVKGSSDFFTACFERSFFNQVRLYSLPRTFLSSILVVNVIGKYLHFTENWYIGNTDLKNSLTGSNFKLFRLNCDKNYNKGNLSHEFCIIQQTGNNKAKLQHVFL